LTEEESTLSIGILAYGSLISRPGPEIEPHIICSKKGVLTPFFVEFARTSRTRGGAPTLVPVSSGGAQVLAQVLVLDLNEEEAKDCLWRREINKVGEGGYYRHPKNPGPNTLIIDQYENFAEVELVLSARFPATIPKPTSERLAELAISSVRNSGRDRDGITYLLEAKREGISTPLSKDYEQEILRRTKATDLAQALHTPVGNA
jgi:cation transport regulator ChaC